MYIYVIFSNPGRGKEKTQSAGARIRISIFNRCNDATVRTREVPLMHASCDVITLITYTQSLHAINGLLAEDEWETYFANAPRIS